MAHLTETLFINVPVASLDTIVADMRNMPKFWVGMSEPENLSGGTGLGSSGEFTQMMLGARLHLTTTVTEERHEPDGDTFWRWEFKGTSAGWLTCHHQPKDGGTQVTTEFEYTVPGSVLGKIADHVIIEHMQKRDFHSSLENLKQLAESMEAERPLAESATAKAG
jgi:hypothetical protein